jgi:hypothetical protein
MMTPQVPAGEQAEAKVQVLMALKVLTKALGTFGPTSAEGKALLSAIKSVAGKFGEDEESTEELQPAAIKAMLGGMAGPGQGPGGPPPGMAPPGTPPGMPPGMPPGGASPGMQ